MQTGDRLGIWAPNCAEWCISQIASAKLGVILVNINPAYRSSELDYVLKQSGCQWLVCAGAFKTSDYHAMVQELKPDLRGLISLDPSPPPGFMPWSQLAALGDQTRVNDLGVVGTAEGTVHGGRQQKMGGPW